MAAKPEIQYVGQFYVYGSEAKKLEPKRQEQRKKAVRPQAQAEQVKIISIDPVALIGLAVAVVMLVCLVVSALRIGETWKEYDAVGQYMAQLKRENAALEHEYANGYDIVEVEAAALALGMIPATEANTIILHVSVPQQEPEPSAWAEFVWFMEGLFA